MELRGSKLDKDEGQSKLKPIRDADNESDVIAQTVHPDKDKASFTGTATLSGTQPPPASAPIPVNSIVLKVYGLYPVNPKMKAALKQLLDDRLIELAARAISGAVTRTGVISSGNMAYVKRLGQLGTAVPEKSRKHRQDRKKMVLIMLPRSPHQALPPNLNYSAMILV